MRKITIILLFLSALFIATRNEQQPPKDIEPPTVPQKDKAEGFHDKFLKFHNKERTSRGLDSLEVDNGLCKYAQKHAELMASENSLFHSNMSDLSDVGGKSVAENIAWGQASEEKVVESWMWSPGHRWNILGPYKRIGFGMKKNKDGRPYWCVVFSN